MQGIVQVHSAHRPSWLEGEQAPITLHQPGPRKLHMGSSSTLLVSATMSLPSSFSPVL